eukprot:g42321.t1
MIYSLAERFLSPRLARHLQGIFEDDILAEDVCIKSLPWAGVFSFGLHKTEQVADKTSSGESHRATRLMKLRLERLQPLFARLGVHVDSIAVDKLTVQVPVFTLLESPVIVSAQEVRIHVTPFPRAGRQESHDVDSPFAYQDTQSAGQQSDYVSLWVRLRSVIMQNLSIQVNQLSVHFLSGVTSFGLTSRARSIGGAPHTKLRSFASFERATLLLKEVYLGPLVENGTSRFTGFQDIIPGTAGTAQAQAMQLYFSPPTARSGEEDGHANIKVASSGRLQCDVKLNTAAARQSEQSHIGHSGSDEEDVHSLHGSLDLEVKTHIGKLQLLQVEDTRVRSFDEFSTLLHQLYSEWSFWSQSSLFPAERSQTWVSAGLAFINDVLCNDTSLRIAFPLRRRKSLQQVVFEFEIDQTAVEVTDVWELSTCGFRRFSFFSRGGRTFWFDRAILQIASYSLWWRPTREQLGCSQACAGVTDFLYVLMRPRDTSVVLSPSTFRVKFAIFDHLVKEILKFGQSRSSAQAKESRIVPAGSKLAGVAAGASPAPALVCGLELCLGQLSFPAQNEHLPGVSKDLVGIMREISLNLVVPANQSVSADGLFRTPLVSPFAVVGIVALSEEDINNSYEVGYRIEFQTDDPISWRMCPFRFFHMYELWIHSQDLRTSLALIPGLLEYCGVSEVGLQTPKAILSLHSNGFSEISFDNLFSGPCIFSLEVHDLYQTISLQRWFWSQDWSARYKGGSSEFCLGLVQQKPQGSDQATAKPSQALEVKEAKLSEEADLFTLAKARNVCWDLGISSVPMEQKAQPPQARQSANGEPSCILSSIHVIVKIDFDHAMFDLNAAALRFATSQLNPVIKAMSRVPQTSQSRGARHESEPSKTQGFNFGLILRSTPFGEPSPQISLCFSSSDRSEFVLELADFRLNYFYEDVSSRPKIMLRAMSRSACLAFGQYMLVKAGLQGAGASRPEDDLVLEVSSAASVKLQRMEFNCIPAKFVQGAQLCSQLRDALTITASLLLTGEHFKIPFSLDMHEVSVIVNECPDTPLSNWLVFYLTSASVSLPALAPHAGSTLTNGSLAQLSIFSFAAIDGNQTAKKIPLAILPWVTFKHKSAPRELEISLLQSNVTTAPLSFRLSPLHVQVLAKVFQALRDSLSQVAPGPETNGSWVQCALKMKVAPAHLRFLADELDNGTINDKPVELGSVTLKKSLLEMSPNALTFFQAKTESFNIAFGKCFNLNGGEANGYLKREKCTEAMLRINKFQLHLQVGDGEAISFWPLSFRPLLNPLLQLVWHVQLPHGEWLLSHAKHITSTSTTPSAVHRLSTSMEGVFSPSGRCSARQGDDLNLALFSCTLSNTSLEADRNAQRPLLVMKTSLSGQCAFSEWSQPLGSWTKAAVSFTTTEADHEASAPPLPQTSDSSEKPVVALVIFPTQLGVFASLFKEYSAALDWLRTLADTEDGKDASEKDKDKDEDKELVAFETTQGELPDRSCVVSIDLPCIETLVCHGDSANPHCTLKLTVQSFHASAELQCWRLLGFVQKPPVLPPVASTNLADVVACLFGWVPYEQRLLAVEAWFNSAVTVSCYNYRSLLFEPLLQASQCRLEIQQRLE